MLLRRHGRSDLLAAGARPAGRRPVARRRRITATPEDMRAGRGDVAGDRLAGIEPHRCRLLVGRPFLVRRDGRGSLGLGEPPLGQPEHDRLRVLAGDDDLDARRLPDVDPRGRHEARTRGHDRPGDQRARALRYAARSPGMASPVTPEGAPARGRVPRPTSSCHPDGGVRQWRGCRRAWTARRWVGDRRQLFRQHSPSPPAGVVTTRTPRCSSAGPGGLRQDDPDGCRRQDGSLGGGTAAAAGERTSRIGQ